MFVIVNYLTDRKKRRRCEAGANPGRHLVQIKLPATDPLGSPEHRKH